MGRVPWSEEEDLLLKNCIEKYGEGNWHRVPLLTGLNRCRKSCRMRWLNYLRPSIKRGTFAEDETDLIIKLHNLLGNRWSLIAARLPGRTANDVKNYWNCHVKKRLSSQQNPQEETTKVIRPQPRKLTTTAATAATSTASSLSATTLWRPSPPSAQPLPLMKPTEDEIIDCFLYETIFGDIDVKKSI